MAIYRGLETENLSRKPSIGSFQMAINPLKTAPIFCNSNLNTFPAFLQELVLNKVILFKVNRCAIYNSPARPISMDIEDYVLFRMI